MAELILHHYQGSLFSEKIRAILGYRQLPWHSVTISPIMPRPLLMPLTGGYRRTPVMQVGADVFCDTHVITEYLDQAHPEPPLVPAALGWAVRSLTARADTHLFQVVVALCFQPAAVAAMLQSMGPELAAKFAADRAELTKGSEGVTRMAPEVAQTYLIDELVRLEAQLDAAEWVCGDGCGDAPTLADFAVYHCLWLLQNNTVVAGLLAPFPRVGAWMQRIAAFGNGQGTALSAEDALQIAKDSEPMDLGSIESSHLPEGVAVGDSVTIAAVDYGVNPIAGRLDYCTAHACAVLRDDPQAGTVRVHFPRSGFRIDPA